MSKLVGLRKSFAEFFGNNSKSNIWRPLLLIDDNCN